MINLLNKIEDFRIIRKEFLASEIDSDESRLYLKILEEIENIVKKEFFESQCPFPYTTYDHIHCENVEKNIYRLIPFSQFSKLKCREKFLLISSIWLHDIGMIPTLFIDNSEKYSMNIGNQNFKEYIKDRNPSFLNLNTESGQQYLEKIRSDHAQRSSIYVLCSCKIQKLRNLYKVESRIYNNFEEDIENISKICRLHSLRADEELDKLNNENWEYNSIRLPLLIAYLRIADTLHIPNKCNDKDFANFLARGPDAVSKFNWFKCKYTKSVYISPEKRMIKFIIRIPGNLSDIEVSRWANKISPLQNVIKKEIQDSLDSVRDILCRGGISFFSLIETSFEIDESLTEELEIQEYEQVLNNIELISDTRKTPSSSLISANIVKTIKLLLESQNEHKIEYLINFDNNVLKKEMKGRSVHALLNPVQERMKKFLNSKSEEDLRDFSDYIYNWNDERKKTIKSIASKTLHIFKETGPILLYGYSDTVLQCIEHFISESHANKLDLYVCEVRPKTEYRYNNRLVFSDGLLNIKTLKEIDPDRIKIYNIPDVAVSNLFANYPNFKVILGTNSIDVDGNATHTLGVRMIADAASIYEVPVYIVAESSKFVNKPLEEPKSKPYRKDWFTTDIYFESILKNSENFNPREDIIPFKRITAFITEKGILKLKDLELDTSDRRHKLLSFFL